MRAAQYIIHQTKLNSVSLRLIPNYLEQNLTADLTMKYDVKVSLL